MAKKKTRRLISKRVEVLDCNCSWDGSRQAEARRYDGCVCKVRVAKGKKRLMVSLPEKYSIGSIFIAKLPKKAWRPEKGEGYG